MTTAVAACLTTLLALVYRCRQRPFAAYLTRAGIAGDIIRTKGRDHTTKEAAQSLGLPDDTRVLKSLIFVVGDVPTLVIARGCDRISLQLLQRHCGVSSPARLASPAEAEAATGFRPGCIPPLASRMPVAVLMDERALAASAPVFTGAGVPGEHLRIAPTELLRASSASVAHLVEPAPRAARTDANSVLSLRDSGCPRGPQRSAQPWPPKGVIAQPERVNADVWAALRLSPLCEEACAVLQVVRVRRLGRLLVFASVQECSDATDARASTAARPPPWAS